VKALTHWIKLVEADERAIDTFVFDRAEASFNAVFADFNGDFGSARQLGNKFQNDLQNIMADLVKQYGGWLQRHFSFSSPPVKIQIDRAGSEVRAETGIVSKKVNIYLPYPVLAAASESDEVFDEVCQLFAGAVGHEFVHVVQLLKKQFTRDQLNAPGSCRRGDFSSATDDRYLSAPHELEAYAHTVAYDLIRVLRKVPETMRAAMLNTILGNRHLMATKSKSYERYVDHAEGATLDALDAMISRLLRQHFAL